MSDKDVIYRWMTQAELERMVESAANMAVDLAVRAILTMDTMVYDEDTIRAAARVVRESIRRTP